MSVQTISIVLAGVSVAVVLVIFVVIVVYRPRYEPDLPPHPKEGRIGWIAGHGGITASTSGEYLVGPAASDIPVPRAAHRVPPVRQPAIADLDGW